MVLTHSLSIKFQQYIVVHVSVQTAFKVNMFVHVRQLTLLQLNAQFQLKTLSGRFNPGGKGFWVI